MQNIDMLLSARWVVPVSENDPCLPEHSVAVHDGRIMDVLPSDDARSRYRAELVHDLDSHVLMPGLVNAHTHAAMTLFRGLSDDIALMEWLQEHIWPAETQWVNADFVQDGTRLAIAEMLRGGTTCFNDMYFFPDVTARVADRAGMRVVVGLIVLDFPTVWAESADEYLEKGIAVHDAWRDADRVHTSFAPHAPYTVSDAPLEKIRSYAHEMDIPVTMHVHETIHEVQQSADGSGSRPLKRLESLGLTSPSLVAVHMTQLEEHEIRLLADNGCHVVHCPESNLKLASGFCPVARLQQAGVNVALGTDGAASNNDLDMLAEMRTAALLAKGVAGDATALPAPAAIRMATINGARALGLEERIGSLEKGKEADIIAINLDRIESAPVYDPMSHIVYCCGRDQVSDVWIAGSHVMKNRELLTLDDKEIVQKARYWRDRIFAADRQSDV